MISRTIATRFLVVLLTLSLLIVSLCLPVSAWTGNGIANNGTEGIYINIYGHPYTTYANKSYGWNAYTSVGCAWFASARACEITGKDTAIWDGQSWYDSAYSYYGYSRGRTPAAKALVCYTGHVAVVEAVYGDTILISEGGNSSFAGNDYCVIRYRTRSAVESNGFLGYVYLGAGPSTEKVQFGNFTGYIYNAYSNMALTTSSTGSWGNVYMSPFVGAKRQLWRFEVDSEGYYTIYSIYDNTCLDVANAATTNGTNLTTNRPSGHNAQKFYFTKSGDAYSIHTKLCGMVIDVKGDETPYDGINVQMWNPNNGNNQKFVLYLVEKTHPGLYAFGDANTDGAVAATDALVVLKQVVGKIKLDSTYREICEVSGDGNINASDALLILKKVVGKINKFPVEP